MSLTSHMTIAELAAELGVGDTTARKRLARAVAAGAAHPIKIGTSVLVPRAEIDAVRSRSLAV